MEHLEISLSYHENQKNWSIAINGRLYPHISMATVDGLVEYAIVAAEERLSGKIGSEPEPAPERRMEGWKEEVNTILNDYIFRI